MLVPVAASPLLECKEALLDVIQTALDQTDDVVCVKSAIKLLSSMLAVSSLLSDSEVTCWVFVSAGCCHGTYLGYLQVVSYSQQLRSMAFTNTKMQ